MTDVTQADIERTRAEAAQQLAEHIIGCERYRGENNVRLARIETLLGRNTKVLYVLLTGMLAVAGKAFWPVLFGA